MKTKILSLTLVLMSISSFAQNQTQQANIIQQKIISENTTYQLFPTINYWTFIKLDTRNGKMWQVHFFIKEGGVRTELSLNSIPLVSDLEGEVNGRFTLYPTVNNYNFLLLDQINGKVYQVQWSMESKKRLVIPIE